MAAEPGSAREAAERNAEAVMTGNLSQVMADITPDALAQMMQLGAMAGNLSPATMPSIEGYEITETGAAADAEVFNVTFRSALGRATVAATWKQIMGQWKIAAVDLVSVEPASETQGQV